MTEARSAWVDALWRGLQVWGVPVGMSGAYLLLIWSSDTDNTGQAWMALGFAFVLVVWFVLRMLTTDAALARALSVGDAPRISDLTGRYLKTHKSASARAPYLVARAFAHELRSEWPQALATLDEADLSALPATKRGPWVLRAVGTRIAALVATGDVTGARRVLETELKPDAPHPLHSDAYLVANLAAGRVLAAEGKRDEAAARLRKVAEDIRATAAMRAAVESVLR
ncbi:MAG: hypothetical protein H0T46_07090 [Deltaproteobacteria bacterium]|nr:hypothetical protein [Deltaproteobacteria bacterium]